MRLLVGDHIAQVRRCIGWTRDSLAELVKDKLSGYQFIVVSNREPYLHNLRGREIVCEVPASGLTTALDPVMRACGGTWIAHGSGNAFTYRTIMITEYIARDLARGYPTKGQLEKALIATARRPAYERAFANYWANPGSAFDPDKYPFEQHLRKVIRDEDAKLTELPPWYPKVPGVEKIYTVPVMEAGMTAMIVTGDPDRNKVQCMPGGSYATIKIELPANWDALMAELGYRPLKEFFLK